MPEYLAVAVISAARGCSEDAAFDELIDVAMHHHVSVGCAAESLIALVGSTEKVLVGPAVIPAEWTESQGTHKANSKMRGAGA